MSHTHISSRTLQALLLSITLIASISTPTPQAHAAASTNPPTGDLRKAIVRIGTLGAVCSGAMISPHWVLTARHCIEKRDINNAKFNTISHITIGDKPSQSRTYTGTTHLHPSTDLALININGTYNGPTLPLASERVDYNDTLIGAGFGGTEQQATVYKFTHNQHHDKEQHGDDFLSNGYRITHDSLKGWETIKGDSGSPALNDKGEIVSILSYGFYKNGNDSTFESLSNPDITHYRDWIMNTAGLDNSGSTTTDSGASDAKYIDFTSDLSSMGSSLASEHKALTAVITIFLTLYSAAALFIGPQFIK